jgi:3D (Asp-Asp-Asp) domain-containing protein
VLAVLAAATLFASSTAYSPCSSSSPHMADGTAVTSRLALRAVASNRLPMHTRIRLIGRTFYGRRRFTVRDTGGAIMQLDFFTPSCARAIAWGRVPLHYRVTRWGRGR